jgi:hypothetical protein
MTTHVSYRAVLFAWVIGISGPTIQPIPLVYDSNITIELLYGLVNGRSSGVHATNNCGQQIESGGPGIRWTFVLCGEAGVA